MKKITIIFTLLFLFASCTPENSELTSEVNVKKIDGIDNVINDGYDVVSYFEEGRMMQGYKDFVIQYKGVAYFFSSKKNFDIFISNIGKSDKYIPKYDGYCAYGVSSFDKKVASNPDAWHIEDDRLYLNDRKIHHIWLKEVDKNIQLGDEKWQVLKDK
ncbi:MAG: YHS domain-containing protein [Lentimonas sp.]|jgi:YHS domain-containing protein